MEFRNQLDPDKKIVAVIGAGFAGLNFCHSFRAPNAEVVLVDRQNHHLFQPLLYQVATAALSAPEIAQPMRSIFAGRRHLSIFMDTIKSLDLTTRTLNLRGHTCQWDYLVLAAGGVTSYFNHPEWERHAHGLKTLADAGRIRNDILHALEQAESETDPARLRRLLTFVIVGGGPTGVEMAGAIAELTKRVMRRDFRRIDPGQARIVLVEGAPRLLLAFHALLSRQALRDLKQLGVEVRLNCPVLDVRPGELQLHHEVLQADNIIWAAGVKAAPMLASLPVPKDRSGRLQVQPDCSLPGFPNVFAIGDCAAITDAKGRAVPGVAPAAMQMGRYVAKILATEFDCKARGLTVPVRSPFVYVDKGSLATIGRSRAVAEVAGLRMTGFPAWILWLFAHLAFLIGFRNRIAVFLQWLYAYATYRRGARIIWSQNVDQMPDEPAT
jgi:NADH dehydrogenase